MEINIINVKEFFYNEKAEDLIKYLEQEKQDRVLKYRRKEDKVRGIIGGILTKVIAAKKNNRNLNEITYKYNEYNKPKFENINDLEFNISHSGDYVITAFDNNALGVDIEKISNMEYKDIAERFFSKEEFKWIIKEEGEKSLRRFYKIWTLKESYVKLLGKGLNIPFDSFSFKYNEEKDVFYLENIKEKIVFFNFQLDNYEISACTYSDKVNIINWDYNKLIEEINKLSVVF